MKMYTVNGGNADCKVFNVRYIEIQNAMRFNT